VYAYVHVYIAVVALAVNLFSVIRHLRSFF